MSAEPTWQPADELVARREKLCDGPRCAVTFTPNRHGQRFCSERCAAQAAAASVLPEPEFVPELTDRTTAPEASSEHHCEYEPCGKPIHPADRGWQKRYCSLSHAQLAKGTVRPVVGQVDQPEPDPEPESPPAGETLTDLRRRYFELLMDLAAKTDRPADDLLDRIERTLEALS